jgi:hypothetical protein
MGRLLHRLAYIAEQSREVSSGREAQRVDGGLSDNKELSGTSPLKHH